MGQLVCLSGGCHRRYGFPAFAAAAWAQPVPKLRPPALHPCLPSRCPARSAANTATCRNKSRTVTRARWHSSAVTTPYECLASQSVRGCASLAGSAAVLCLRGTAAARGRLADRWYGGHCLSAALLERLADRPPALCPQPAVLRTGLARDGSRFHHQDLPVGQPAGAVRR